MTTTRPRRGILDGNDRLAATARWLKQSVREKNAYVLRLDQRDEEQEWETLSSWEKEEVEPALAEQICELVQDAADEAGTFTAMRLQWTTEDGKVLMQKMLRAHPTKEKEQRIHPMDGSMVASLSAAQRHVEAAVQTVMKMADQQAQTFSQMMGIQSAFLEKLADKLDIAQDAAEHARAERDEAMEAATEAALLADEASAAAEAAKTDSKLGQVVEVAFKQLSQGNGNAGGG